MRQDDTAGGRINRGRADGLIFKSILKAMGLH